MLRISVHNDRTPRRLELAGRLEGPWVAETEHAWRAAARTTKGIEVDIRQLTAIDNSGRALLSTMYRAGAHFLGEGVWITDLIETITGKHSSDVGNRLIRKSKSPHGATSHNRGRSNG